MPSNAKGRQGRSLSGKLALGLTQLWLVYAALHLLLQSQLGYDAKTGFHLAPNYLLLAGTALIPAAAWTWLIVKRNAERRAGKSLDELKSLSPSAFEEWVAARFRDLGFSARVVGARGDHGIDISLRKDDEKAVVQCKAYREWSVGEPILRDLLGAMHASGASRAYLVTTGRLTKAAEAWVRGKPIEVWDGDRLARLSSPPAPAAASSPTLEASAPLPDASLDDDEAIALAGKAVVIGAGTDRCPMCSSVLVERRNKRTGEVFLGCSRFPSCRYTRKAHYRMEKRADSGS